MSRAVSVWVLPDQLTTDHPGLAAAEAEVGRDNVRVVLIESRSALRRLPYHRKRQVLHLSAGRHFAGRLRDAGYAVDLIAAPDSRAGLLQHVGRHRPARLVTMAAADFPARRWQAGAMADDLRIEVEVLPNAMFLVGRYDPIPAPEPGRRYVMESFYRAMRKRFGLLMERDGTPCSGRWNLDADNRRRLPRGRHVPEPPRFEPDEITRRVMAEVESSGHGVGSTRGFDLAVTHADAEAAFDDFLAHRLADFGPYEDAMSRESGVLYHSALSPQMNLGLLEPLSMARSAEAEYRAGRVPLNSAEGFIRQVIGWREFIHWQYHRQMPGLRSANAWDARRPLPRLFWDGETDLRCLGRVVRRLIATGYTHHIERLMVICNFCLLAGVDPAAVADWFLSFYADSHDWVVLPNVIGMGLNADGGLTATKPYIASAAYINRMSDFCPGCSYRPDRRTGEGACPFNTLYWNFLIEHEGTLRSNPRLGPAVLGLSRLGGEEREAVRRQAAAFLESLEAYAGPAPEPDTRRVEEADLPEEACARSGRPFSRRQGLAAERERERVEYCSDACREGRGRARGGPAA
ncbi:Deoxyribodipyrimidine photo-lyase-related protein [Aquisphaera giovannonii]|uniref:Deoxyribodipyrimidine photo-lyase-related protein n=1 Tax=Aquisphaera giovannonii TaxID=406548 RepID=A0A5B9W3P2_9BACT|nr:cryptochrome/photolyase family protein [Aquisphaera giovannonii]QEH35236.1 Deoxyribodipyrimidine photo-lyase-related protein [Aquisphaera giovannonii]